MITVDDHLDDLLEAVKFFYSSFSLLVVSYIPLTYPNQCFVLLNTFLLSAPGLFCMFSASALELIISPGSPGSFYWRMILDTKIWVLGTHCYWGAHASVDRARDMCVSLYILTYL